MNELEHFISETLESIETPLTKERVLKVVCDHFGVTEEGIKGKARGSRVVTARHFYMYLLRKKGIIRTVQGIGEELNKNHATVIYAVNKLEHWIKNYVDVSDIFNKLNNKL